MGKRKKGKSEERSPLPACGLAEDILKPSFSEEEGSGEDKDGKKGSGEDIEMRAEEGKVEERSSLPECGLAEDILKPGFFEEEKGSGEDRDEESASGENREMKEGGGKSEEPSPLPACGLAEDILGPGICEEKGSGEDGDGEKASGENREMRKVGGNGGFDEEELMKFVSFFLDSEEYALPISQVQEINRVGEITRVPNSPEHVMGVINLRGKIVPVIELKHRLKLGQTNISKESRIVVVEQGPKLLGLMVDRVSQVLSIGSEQIDETPEDVVQVQENYIKGVGKIEERMIILLDLEQIIGMGVEA